MRRLGSPKKGEGLRDFVLERDLLNARTAQRILCKEYMQSYRCFVGTGIERWIKLTIAVVVTGIMILTAANLMRSPNSEPINEPNTAQPTHEPNLKRLMRSSPN